MYKYSILMLSLILITSVDCYTYRGSFHEEITEMAFEIIKENNINVDLQKIDEQNVINYSDYEGSGIKKIFNGNYYNPYQKQKYNCTITSSYSRVEELTLELIEEKQLDDGLDILGRIIHHIQDMTVPSNVAPIRHGALILEKDQFRNYKKRSILLAAIKDSTKYNDLQVQNISFLNLYKKTSLETYEFIKNNSIDSVDLIFRKTIKETDDTGEEKEIVKDSTILENIQLDLTKYWLIQNSENKYFNNYGKFGYSKNSSDLFGENLIQISKNRFYCVKKEEYDKIYTSRLEKALKQTIIAILIFNSKLDQFEE